MAYIGNSPGVASQRVESAFTATSSQTVFTPSSGYTLGYCDVYQNGVKLVNGDDYTASDGVTVTLATGAASGDSIVIVASFPRGLTDGYLKSEADAKYVALTGDQTVAGVKTFSSQIVGIAGTAGAPAVTTTGDTDTGIFFPAANTLAFSTNGTEDARFDANGNLGLGVTPSAWSGAGKIFEAGAVGSAIIGWGASDVSIGCGAYYNGSWKYAATNSLGVSQYELYNGAHYWAGAAPTSHTAGDAATLTTRMVLDASGNLVIGATTVRGTYKLDIRNDNSIALGSNATYFGTIGYSAGTGLLSLAAESGGGVNFLSGSTERARIDSNGALLINATSRANAPDHTLVKLAVYGEAHLQSQGSHLWFGDSTNSSPLGIGEGLVNTVYTDSDFLSVYYRSSCRFLYNTTETVRITSNGNLLLGATSGSARLYVVGDNTNPNILTSGAGGGVGGITENFHGDIFFAYADLAGQNTANANIKVGRIGATGRSINAGGTINASGADYAEYMTKCSNEFVVAKGDVVGVNAVGKLTNVFADAVSFVVKSTDPSYVGGDSWGVKSDDKDGEQYTEEELEAQRQLVDRIAFAGQVPVNVTGATPGQYIIPVNDNGAIKGEAVSNPTFEQYQQAVGKVIAIEQDGRARIIVKVA